MSRLPSAITMQWKGTTQPSSRVISPSPTILSNDVTVPRISGNDLADRQLQDVGGAGVFPLGDERVAHAFVDSLLDPLPAVGQFADGRRSRRGQHAEQRLEVIGIDVEPAQADACPISAAL